MEKTLIINYPGMMIGGIETYFSTLMLNAVKKGCRVVWLTDAYNVENAQFREVVESPKIEKVYVGGGMGSLSFLRKLFFPGEEIIMLSCDPLRFIRAESLRRGVKNIGSFFHFLVLPHYKGYVYYPERAFKSGLIKLLCHNYMECIVHRMVENDCLRAFSLKHLDEYENNYRVIIEDKRKKILKGLFEKDKIDNAFILKKAKERKTLFKITACTRFDFPHKSFILGLIQKYGIIKSKYPQVHLTVIGYGSGETEVKNRISQLSEFAKKDIILTGQLLPEEVKKVFYYSHLNVGLAGALSLGAKCAVPSLLVRHYSDSCETYGFYSSNTKNLLRDDPGDDIIPYIERVINAGPEEYERMSLEDYSTSWNRNQYDQDYVFREINTSSKSIISLFDSLIAFFFKYIISIKQRLRLLKSYDDERV